MWVFHFRSVEIIMFHKVINENIAIPKQNILLQSQSTTRSSWKDSYRQIQCSKDSYKFSFFCQTIKDWNKLSLDITKNTTIESCKGALTHDVLLDTYPYLKGVHLFTQGYILTRLLTDHRMPPLILYTIRLKYRYKN
jgi:hypothetical protein